MGRLPHPAPFSRTRQHASRFPADRWYRFGPELENDAGFPVLLWPSPELVPAVTNSRKRIRGGYAWRQCSTTGGILRPREWNEVGENANREIAVERPPR